MFEPTLLYLHILARLAGASKRLKPPKMAKPSIPLSLLLLHAYLYSHAWWWRDLFRFSSVAILSHVNYEGMQAYIQLTEL